LQVYELAEGQPITTTIPSLGGDELASLKLQREGRTITVEPTGSLNNWRVLLVGDRSVRSIEGGTAENQATGTLVTPQHAGANLMILLDMAP
ncbi:MAG: hypothetical protein M3R24_35500, partial [Chloroflexota bacterium]|nr:hypothetical protein [Chloroflexota bacterium]